MKRIRKLLAVVMALTMVLAFGITASAASLTIKDNNAEGTESGEMYVAYKIFDATYPEGTGDSTQISNVAYTFDATKHSEEQKAIIENYFDLNEINHSGIYNVKAKEGLDADGVKNFASALKEKLANFPTYQDTVPDSVDGKSARKFENLPQGYYLVTDSLGTALVVDTIGDVVITTKNEYPTIEKTADKTTAGYGETVTYTITIEVPPTANSKITVVDEMTNLTFVALDDESTTKGVTRVDSSTPKKSTFEISKGAVTDAVKNKTDITIKYTATVDGGKNEATNTAYLTYSGYKSELESTTVNNYKFDVFKYTIAGGNEQPLAGAGFIVSRNNTDGENSAVEYYKYDTSSKIVTWTTNEDDATVLRTTENNGAIVTFEGLANGTYTLIEKEVPAGYNKANDTPVEIINDNKIEGKRIEVLNQTGTELPSTGGVGTTVFYVLGGVLVAGAAVLLITKKRMNKN